MFKLKYAALSWSEVTAGFHQLNLTQDKMLKSIDHT